jgi:nickel-dependent lactate racemase
MPAHPAIGHSVPQGQSLSPDTVRHLVETGLPRDRFAGQRVLLIIPDGTRTAPVGLLFKTVHRQLAGSTRALDILVALGTHQPMSEAAICERLEITPAERQSAYAAVRFFNHAWNDPQALRHIGTLPANEIRDLTDGRFAMDVPVEVNRLLFDYDQILIIGPVFPHEVVGFSGGNKYLFPGVGGPQILNFFHWLAAVISTPKIIGNKWTAVRKVVDRAGAMVTLPKTCLCAVVDGAALAGLFIGTPEDAWSAAADLSRDRHILYQDRPFHTIFACAPKMYDEIWTGGKCMYKLEPVLADGGELIIYAPHISELCVTHGRTILEVGYHCRDYFVKQWDRFKNKPWGVLAHSTHVHGLGTYENGVETPRARVTLATAIPESVCRQVNLGYRDPATLRPEDYAHREAEGILLVPKAGEILYRLKHPPAWAV